MTSENVVRDNEPADFPIVKSDGGFDFEPAEPAAENALKVVGDRLHGRWRFAIILGLVLSPIFAWVAYSLAPVKFRSASVLVVESSLDALVEETIETANIREFAAFVMEKAQQVRDTQVFLTAFEDPELGGYELERPNFRDVVFDNLVVNNPRRSSLVIVSMEDADPRFAASAVNAMVAAYRSVYAPDPMVEHKGRVDKIERLIGASRSKLGQLKLARNEVSIDARYGRSDLTATIEDNVLQIRSLSLRIEETKARMNQIREQHAVKARLLAEKEDRKITPKELEPGQSARLDPSLRDLLQVDAKLNDLNEAVMQARVNFEVTSRRFGPLHLSHRREKMNYETLLANFDGRMEAARVEWSKQIGDDSSWAALLESKATLESELERIVQTNMELEKVRIEAEDYDGQIGQESTELAKLEDRMMTLQREKEAIREGRIRFPKTKAVPAFAPTSDKKMTAALGGFVGGWFVSFAFFFLLGTIDQRTFGVRQLQDKNQRLRVLGVLPNMDEVGSDSSTVMLASDCIHRIRGRIESRRAPEHGYAMMISSPFQGDGKTTLAVSLGWSYAESGYKTLLIDSDFVGRAMTHQFGRLKDPGLREVIRNGSVSDEIVELGHPQLNLLSVGFDRRISAANLSPRLFARMLEAVRADFDVIIVDSGPITASIEALPIASAVDGVVLTLSRGRSRVRLSECIEDIRAGGADYLGVVLNQADRSDCERYGSNSKMSARVADALGDETGRPLNKNPLLEGLGVSKNP